MQRSRIPYIFLALSGVIAAAALVILIVRTQQRRHSAAATPVPLAGVAKSDPPVIDAPRTPVAPEDPETILKNLGTGVAAGDPADLVARIAKALEAGDIATAGRLIGKEALDPATLERLKALADAGSLRLRQPNGVREVGEMEVNAFVRWALELDGKQPGRDRIFLDLRRKQGKWAVEKLILPPAADESVPEAVFADSLGTADAFLQAVLRQDFESARGFVDPKTVSDAKIAGLCILFEEGEYRMKKTKPLRTMYQKPEAVGYLANVETSDGQQNAHFGISLRQPSAASKWVVSEINLDQLLADYARRVAGGDLYYSPLVKNPSGGDTLALYFEFDEDQINPRTRRQLEIVALILRTDPGKKITLSGHTDALGTIDYNNSLSSRRARVVEEFLAKAGVSPAQIILLAKGASQPRRPNVTESGEDDPGGRRANRRTEIYLDF